MPWQPGESGNPNGVKNQKRFLGALNRALAQSDGDKLRSVVEKLIACAEQGESWAVKELADRLDGKVPQQLIHAGDEDNPLRVEKIVRGVAK